MSKPTISTDATPDPTLTTSPPGSTLGREAAAKLLGVSMGTFRRRYHGVRLQGRREGTAYVFDRAEVEALARELRQPPPPPPPPRDERTEAEAITDVFALLDEGLGPVDVVRRLRVVHADLVERAFAQWLRLKGGLWVEGDDVTALRAHARTLGARLPGSGTELATLAGEALSLRARPPRACSVCARRAAEVCPGCMGREQAAEKKAEREFEREKLARERTSERERRAHEKGMRDAQVLRATNAARHTAALEERRAQMAIDRRAAVARSAASVEKEEERARLANTPADENESDPFLATLEALAKAMKIPGSS